MPLSSGCIARSRLFLAFSLSEIASVTIPSFSTPLRRSHWQAVRPPCRRFRPGQRLYFSSSASARFASSSSGSAGSSSASASSSRHGGRSAGRRRKREQAEAQARAIASEAVETYASLFQFCRTTRILDALFQSDSDYEEFRGDFV